MDYVLGDASRYIYCPYLSGAGFRLNSSYITNVVGCQTSLSDIIKILSLSIPITSDQLLVRTLLMFLSKERTASAAESSCHAVVQPEGRGCTFSLSVGGWSRGQSDETTEWYHQRQRNERFDDRLSGESMKFHGELTEISGEQYHSEPEVEREKQYGIHCLIDRGEMSSVTSHVTYGQAMSLVNHGYLSFVVFKFNPLAGFVRDTM